MWLVKPLRVRLTRVARRAAHEECRWEMVQLPIEVASGLHVLMSELGLVFGAVDLICTPSGEYVFLELNPCGEFFWLEHAPGLPISDAIADLLLGHAPRR